MANILHQSQQCLLQLEEDTEFEEIQEARAAYRQSFQPAPRATEADSDYKSVYRKLSDMLYFIVKNPREQWQMPQGPLSEGENLTQVTNTVSHTINVNS